MPLLKRSLGLAIARLIKITLMLILIIKDKNSTAGEAYSLEKGNFIFNNTWHPLLESVKGFLMVTLLHTPK